MIMNAAKLVLLCAYGREYLYSSEIGQAFQGKVQ